MAKGSSKFSAPSLTGGTRDLPQRIWELPADALWRSPFQTSSPEDFRATEILCQMNCIDFQPIDVTFGSSQPACLDQTTVEKIPGQTVFSGSDQIFILRFAFAFAFADIFAENGRVEDARHAFDKISQPDDVSGAVWPIAMEYDQSRDHCVSMFVDEENVENASHVNPHCDQCRGIGGSHHLIPKSRYLYFILAAATQGEFKLSVLEMRTNLLHGMRHSNGFGHLFSLNSREKGFSKFTSSLWQSNVTTPAGGAHFFRSPREGPMSGKAFQAKDGAEEEASPLQNFWHFEQAKEAKEGLQGEALGDSFIKTEFARAEIKWMGSAILRRLDFEPELFDEMSERAESTGNAYLGPDSFQIQIKLLSGKTLLQWVGSQDHVRDLTRALELKLGIPSEAQRLLHEGKQLEDLYPLSYYNINRNASITLSLRLRGGAAGQSSSAKAFSYKDAVHPPKQEKKVPPVQAPKPFLVDKLEETPSIEIMHPSLDEQTQHLAERGIICRFNGLWPRTADLYQWIQSNWTNNCKVLFCSKGFFITVFPFEEDYQTVLKEGPWFWGSAGLFLTPWFPDFDPSSAIITKLPIWVRLPNLPAHLWHFAVFQGIGNTLGRLLDIDTSRGQKGLYTYARICVEIDISKGLPDKINLKTGDFHWTQILDYENTAFRCRNCHLTGHLQSSCPSKPAPNQKSNPKQKSKSWKPHDPPPMDDFDFSSDEEEMNEEDMETKTSQEQSSAVPEDLSVPPGSQKRNHGSTTSDSDKELSQSTQISLQITPVQQRQHEWVKVGKKKEKKLRIVDPSHVG